MNATEKLTLIKMDITRALNTGINCEHARQTMEGILWLINLEEPAPAASTDYSTCKIVPFPGAS
jgi:hypothetical protein